MGGRTLTIELGGGPLNPRETSLRSVGQLLGALMLAASAFLGGCAVEVGDPGDEDVGIVQDELAGLGTDYALTGEIDDEDEGGDDPGEEEQSGDNPKGGPEPTPWHQRPDTDDSTRDPEMYVKASSTDGTKDDRRR
jgi:hypothetical protein